MIDLPRSALAAAACVVAWLAAPPPALAQVSASDLIVRIERLENQIRQLTGVVEQLQFRNQQLEQQVKRTQDDAEFRFQELGAKGNPRTPAQPVRSVAPAQPLPPANAGPPQRSDVFDPVQSPNAPGAPRTLGTIASTGPAIEEAVVESPGVGVPGGRAAGAPLDLSTLAGQPASDPAIATSAPGLPSAASGPLPPPPPRNPNATGPARVAGLAPAATAKDEYDLAYGHVLRKDYALADQGFRAFLQKYPSDRLAPEATYWLGETLYQRQRYRDAAESFLAVSTDYGTAAKAPDALLRLGQSLAALGEKEAACSTFGEVGRKYPRASVSVKQSVERELRRVRC